jgi:hypothetical protein
MQRRDQTLRSGIGQHRNPGHILVRSQKMREFQLEDLARYNAQSPHRVNHRPI